MIYFYLLLVFLFFINIITFFKNKKEVKKDILFTINGERYSGTNFLYKLLKINNIPVIQKEYFWSIYPFGKIFTFWKHGVPHNSIKNKANTVVCIFIFRDLNYWLKSIWKRPDNTKTINNFELFLTSKYELSNRKLKLKIYDRNLNFIYKDDYNKNIFEIRYFKFNKILEYKNNNKNIIFVNLNYLQNKDNAKIFIKEIIKKYNLKLDHPIISEIELHTKTNKKEKNRNIQAPDCSNIINNFKNNAIENFIDNLTYEFY